MDRRLTQFCRTCIEKRYNFQVETQETQENKETITAAVPKKGIKVTIDEPLDTDNGYESSLTYITKQVNDQVSDDEHSREASPSHINEEVGQCRDLLFKDASSRFNFLQCEDLVRGAAVEDFQKKKGTNLHVQMMDSKPQVCC